jgi:hypothetical protein
VDRRRTDDVRDNNTERGFHDWSGVEAQRFYFILFRLCFLFFLGLRI